MGGQNILTKFFIGFLVDLVTPKRHFEINSPFCRLKIARKPPGNSVKQIYVVLFSVTYPQSYNFFQIIILGHILHVSRYVYEPRYLPTNCYIIYSTCLFVYNIGTLRDVKKTFLTYVCNHYAYFMGDLSIYKLSFISSLIFCTYPTKT